MLSASASSLSIFNSSVGLVITFTFLERTKHANMDYDGMYTILYVLTSQMTDVCFFLCSSLFISLANVKLSAVLTASRIPLLSPPLVAAATADSIASTVKSAILILSLGRMVARARMAQNGGVRVQGAERHT